MDVGKCTLIKSFSHPPPSTHPQPTLKLLQASPSMWHVCTCNPFLFLSCSINLCVQPDVGRESCIPNTKNNHFSGKGCVCECRWAEVVVLGTTHSSQAWDLTAVTVEGGKDGDERYNIFSANPFARKCLLQWMWNPNPSLMRSILAWCRAAKGGGLLFPELFQSIAFKEHAPQTANNIIQHYDLQAGNTLKQHSLLGLAK